MIWDDIGTFPIFSAVMQLKLPPTATARHTTDVLEVRQMRENDLQHVLQQVQAWLQNWLLLVLKSRNQGFISWMLSSIRETRSVLALGLTSAPTSRVWRLFEALLMLNTFSQDIVKIIKGSIHPRVNQSHPNPDGRLLRFPSVPRVARRASWICRVIPSPAAVSARSWRSCAGKNRWNRLVKWD